MPLTLAQVAEARAGGCVKCALNDDGTCRRFPPQIVAQAPYKNSRKGYMEYPDPVDLFPGVRESGWCGEFVRKAQGEG